MFTIDEMRLEDVDALADVLHACVHGGASVSFVLPFSYEDACAVWREKVLPGVKAGTRRVLVARDDDGRAVGTVQVDLATPPNQKHRADILKLLVHPEARRHGLARKLMSEAERIAAEERRTLLTLDTVTGGYAERLYHSLGYTLLGIMPRYSKPPLARDLEACSFFYKELAITEPSSLRG